VVCYLPYDPEFPFVFEAIRKLIQATLGSITVEHVGSTAIPGIGGRGVLDIAVPTTAEEYPGVQAAMLELGFQDSPFPHYLPLLAGRFKWDATEYPVLLYLIPPESSVYQDWLKFRDHMRSNAADASAYDTVKRQVIGLDSVDAEQYQVNKTPFIQSVARKIQ
jgi:GrpB-like predicted nucleotidyltransferase (UPF0157 family)